VKIKFWIDGEIKPQARPRTAVIAGHAIIYDPKESKEFKNFVKMTAAKYAPVSLLEGPLALSITVYRMVPKSFSAKRRVQALDPEDGRIYPVTRPDVSNYVKGIEDALTGIIWKDDAQITDLFVFKRFGEKPGAQIIIQGG